MSYCFFLDELMIPVPPESMSLTVSSRNKTLELINDGEINIIRDPGLTEIAFDVRLPGSYRPYADYNSEMGGTALSMVSNKILGQEIGGALNFKSPKTYIEKLEKLKTSKEPFEFVVTRTTDSGGFSFGTNLTVTLEDYSIEEDAEEGFDIKIPVKLKQYKDYATKEVEIKTDAKGNQTVTVKENRRTKKSIAKQLKIGKEKSLWEVCQKVANGGLSWRTLMSLNGLTNPIKMPKIGTILHLGSKKSKNTSSVSKMLKT